MVSQWQKQCSLSSEIPTEKKSSAAVPCTPVPSYSRAAFVKDLKSDLKPELLP